MEIVEINKAKQMLGEYNLPGSIDYRLNDIQTQYRPLTTPSYESNYADGRQNYMLGKYSADNPLDNYQQIDKNNLKGYGSTQYMNSLNLPSDKPRHTDLGVRISPQPQQVRRQTVGGGALDGLIAEFRNNSLGDDLRKLKDAHKQIIDELKKAFFSKKSKKKDMTKKQTKIKPPQYNPGQYPPDTKPSQAQRASPSIQRRALVSDMHPSQRPDRIAKLSGHEKTVNQVRSGPVIQDHLQTKVRYHTVHSGQIPSNTHTNDLLQLRKNPHDLDGLRKNDRELGIYKDIRENVLEYSRRAKLQNDSGIFEGVDSRIVQEILSLRETRITLMKQLNQQTTNHNRAMFENKKLIAENSKLREQLLSKGNMQNIPQLEYLSKENQRLKERVQKLENELSKIGSNKPQKNRLVQQNIKLEKDLQAAEKQIDRLHNTKSPKNGYSDGKSQLQKVKQQLLDEQARNYQQSEELERYRNLFGRLDPRAENRATNHTTTANQYINGRAMQVKTQTFNRNW